MNTAFESPQQVRSLDVSDRATPLSIGEIQVETTVPEWPNCRPDAVMTELKKLDPDSEPGCLGTNTKRFFSSYPVWAALSPEQKNKTLKYFKSLSEPKRSFIVEAAKLESAKDAKIEKQRKDAVSKDDLVRLLELKKLPAAQALWKQTEETMSRRVLDARKSTDAPGGTASSSLADDADPWGNLAALFNDYKGFSPQNAVIQYEEKDGVSQPIVPFRPESVDVAVIASHCHDLNPCNLQRRNIFRDGAWLKEQWSALKTWLSAVFADFNRSGQMMDRGEAVAVK